MMKSPDEIAQAGKDMIDTFTQSSTAFAAGCNEINQHVATLTQKSVMTSLTASKEALDIKTPNEWVDLQSKWASNFMTSAVTQMTPLSQLSAKTIRQTYEPLQKHFGALFDKRNGSQ